MKRDPVLKKILSFCTRRGYTRVAIHATSKKVPSSKMYGGTCVGSSIFAYPDRRNGAWPAIWDLPDYIGVETIGGNYQQVFCATGLQPQVWGRNGNRWERIDKK